MAQSSGVKQAETDEALSQDPDTMIYRMEGPLFFGIAAEIAEVLDRIGEAPKRFVLDCAAVPLLDLTGAHALKTLISRFHKAETTVIFRHVNPEVEAALYRFGVLEGGAQIEKL